MDTYIRTPASRKYTGKVHRSDKMHSAPCSSSLPRSLPDQGTRIFFPHQDTLIFLWHHHSHNQPCCWRAEFYFPLAASRGETGLQGHQPHPHVRAPSLRRVPLHPQQRRCSPAQAALLPPWAQRKGWQNKIITSLLVILPVSLLYSCGFIMWVPWSRSGFTRL